MRNLNACIPPLVRAGLSQMDAYALRRIAMTLHSWHELECGSDRGCIEREEKWAIERAAWPASDPVRWWNGKAWGRRADRQTYDDYTRHAGTLQLPPDAAWRETGEKPFWRDANNGRSYATPDRERGALRRLAAIMAGYPDLTTYVQGDPRGASLYVLRPGDIPEGSTVDSCYSRGLAVYR